MVWTDITRPQYERKHGRYASDCNDKEWQLVEPFLPPQKPIGRSRTTQLRDVWDAIEYMASTGCQWAMIPNDFPPPSTVQRYFYDWRDNGILHQINHALVMAAREAEGRGASPSAGVIDRQSVKTTESGGVCGYDAGKKIKGRKRHIVTDTIGFLIEFVIHAADIQDRDGLFMYSNQSATPIRGCAMYSQMAVMQDPNCKASWRKSVAGQWRLSNALTRRLARA